MTDETDELQNLIDECIAVKVEKEFESRWARIEMYHKIGEYITQSEVYKREGTKIFVTVTQQTKIKKRNLYRAVQFYNMFTDLNTLPEGKDVSWHKICNKHLTEADDKKEPEMCTCPVCGKEHRKETANE